MTTTQEAAQPPVEAIARSMRLIQDDCIEDAKRDDGKPVTGLLLGTHLGGIYAMIAAIAHAVELLATGATESTQEATGRDE